MTPSSKMGDLKTRTLSAVVMIAVAGSALWAGGWVFTAFVALIAAGLLWEWWGLISKFNAGVQARVLWMLGGVVYVGGACSSLLLLRFASDNYKLVTYASFVIGLVIVVDVGAYLTGRLIGGPKIAPQISPSKTWSGLIGAMIFSSIYAAVFSFSHYHENEYAVFWIALFVGYALIMAVIAQCGDFFESWLKRRAGVKDSGALIPGHGGLFDRLDGLIAAACATFVIPATMYLASGKSF